LFNFLSLSSIIQKIFVSKIFSSHGFHLNQKAHISQIVHNTFFVFHFKFSGKNKFLKSEKFLNKTDLKFIKFTSNFLPSKFSLIILFIKVVLPVDFGQ